ncbi:hypothetical protein [Ekhidna sp.]|uniref:hypothetical protein n=1 Tax=Ekhidna sp. TaxID=2608089 RepID=UPI0032976614
MILLILCYSVQLFIGAFLGDPPQQLTNRFLPIPFHHLLPFPKIMHKAEGSLMTAVTGIAGELQLSFSGYMCPSQKTIKNEQKKTPPFWWGATYSTK